MKSYGTISSPDEDLENQSIAYNGTRKQFGESEIQSSEEETSEHKPRTHSSLDYTDDEENGDIIPFLDDSELETQQLIEMNQRLRTKRRPNDDISPSKRFKDAFLFSISMLSIIAVILFVNQSSTDGSGGDHIFESSIMTNSTRI